MPQALSLQTVIEANRLGSEVPFLTLIDLEVVDPDTGVVVTVLNFANNNEPVLFAGNEYTASRFDLKISTEVGKTATVSLTFVDFTQALETYLEQYGGGVGFNVTFYLVNAAALFDDPEIVEFFQITGVESANFMHSFTLGAENTLTLTFPRRIQRRDFCANRYKDPDTCRYTGAIADCDLTLKGPNGCVAHANSINFGGFPGINSNGWRYA
jgi:phage-related protein